MFVWLLDLGFWVLFGGFGMFGTYIILFGSIFVDAFWTFVLELSMDFIFF